MSTDILQWLVFCRSVGGLTLIVCSHFGTMNQVRKFLGGLVYLHVQVPRSSSCGCCCSVAKSCLTLQPCGLQHSGLPCSSLSPGVCSHSCLLSQWCDLTISSSAAPFFSCPQSYPASRSFPVSQLFTSGGQIIGALASTSAPPVKVQDWFPLGLTGLISLLSKGLCRVFSSTKHQLLSTQPSFWSNFHIHTWLLEKNHSFDYIDLSQQSDISAF